MLEELLRVFRFVWGIYRSVLSGGIEVSSDVLADGREIGNHAYRYSRGLLILAGVMLAVGFLFLFLNIDRRIGIAGAGIYYMILTGVLIALGTPLTILYSLIKGGLQGLGASGPVSINTLRLLNPATVTEDVLNILLKIGVNVKTEVLCALAEASAYVKAKTFIVLAGITGVVVYLYAIMPWGIKEVVTEPGVINNQEQVAGVIFFALILTMLPKLVTHQRVRKWLLFPILVCVIAYLTYTMKVPSGNGSAGKVVDAHNGCVKEKENPLECLSSAVKGEESVPGADEIVSHFYAIPAPDPKNPDLFIKGPCIRAGHTAQVWTAYPERVGRSTITPVVGGGEACPPEEWCVYSYADMLAKVFDYTPEEIQQIAEDPNRSWTEGMPTDAPPENLNIGWFINPDSPGPASVTVRFRPSDLC